VLTGGRAADGLGPIALTRPIRALASVAAGGGSISWTQIAVVNDPVAVGVEPITRLRRRRDVSVARAPCPVVPALPLAGTADADVFSAGRTGVTGFRRIRAALRVALAAARDHVPAARRWGLAALPCSIADPGLASTTGARRALGRRGVLAGAVLAGVGGAGIAIVAVGITQALRALPSAIAHTGRARRPGGGRFMLAGGRPAAVERAGVAIVALGVAIAAAGNRGQDTAAGGGVAGSLATDRSSLARAADPAAAIRAALFAIALRCAQARAIHAGVVAAAGAAGAMAAIITTG